MIILRKLITPIIALMWIGILINSNSHFNDFMSFFYYEKSIINFIRSISVLIVILLFTIFYFKEIQLKFIKLIIFFYFFIIIQIISFLLIRDLTKEYDQFYFIFNQFLMITFFYFIISLKKSSSEKLYIFENLFKILIIFILIAIIVLGKNLYLEFLNTNNVNFYYGYFVSPHSQFLGQGVPRITGISRLVLILAITTSIFLLYGKYKIGSFLVLSFLISMLLLGDTRFAIYSFLIVSLFLIMFDKKYSLFKKFTYFISLILFAYSINFSLSNIRNSTFVINSLNINKDVKVTSEEEKKILEKSNLMKNFRLNADEWYLNRRMEKSNEFDSRLFQDFSTSGRIEDWKNNILRIKQRPLLGYGFQADRYLTNEPVSNAYIYSLISGGIVGFLLFTSVAFLSFLKCLKVIFIDKIFHYNSRIILKCSVIINLVILLRSLIENSFSVYNFDLLLFLITYSIMSLNETNSKKNNN